MQNKIDTPQLTNEDISQLNSLALAYYIVGGLNALLGLFFLIPVAVGIGIVSGAIEFDAPPASGWIFVAVGLLVIAISEALSICMVITGKHLNRRTGYTFSFVVACISCTNTPLGTILGILTIIVLSRPSVKAAFGEA